jgi:hypothetical protein
MGGELAWGARGADLNAANASPQPPPDEKPEPVNGPANATTQAVPSLLDVYPEQPGTGTEPKKVALALRQRETWAFPPEERRLALALLPIRDPDFKRTRSLVHALADDRQLGLDAVRFGAEAVADEIGDSVSPWPPSASPNPDLGATLLERMAERLGPRIRVLPKKGDTSRQTAARRAYNALMIATEYLSIAMGLAAEDAVPILRLALGAPSEPAGQRSNRRRVRMRALTDVSLGRDRVRALLELLQPWIEQLREAREAEAAAARESASLGAQTSELSREIEALRDQERDLTAALEEARQKEADARDRLRDAKALAESDLREVRGKLASSLDSRVRSKLEIAAEAAAVDPPRTRVSQRKIADALGEIEEQVKWLRSSA